MEDEEYQVALLRHLHIPLPIITQGLHCTCSGRPNLDPYGHHFVTACGIHGVPTEIHDTFRNKFNQILHETGYWAVAEENDTFGDALPENRNRSDIVIKSPQTLDKGSTALIDFTFACLFERSRSGNIDNGRLTARIRGFMDDSGSISTSLSSSTEDQWDSAVIDSRFCQGTAATFLTERGCSSILCAIISFLNAACAIWFGNAQVHIFQ
jgi:hypothetical protein